ncbi:MAG: adenine phosphoribosyltransferase [Planctomycetes bacterium]|nr:adenine phosphoribosyltransferase [Planctomycetota bacterium]
MALDLKDYIRSIPGFPKEGIVFRDITPLLADAAALREASKRIADHFRDKKPELVVGAEARGFIFGTAVALELDVGFAPVRKPGKLPAKTVEYSYELEYGTDTLTMHWDAVKPGQKVLLIDDLLATGGTMEACAHMVEELGGEVVGCGFVIELSFLDGRKKFSAYDVFSLIDYESEDET